MFKRLSRFIIVVIIIIPTLFTACRPSGNGSGDQTQLPTATALPEPTLAPERVILVPSGEVSPEIISEAESLVSQLAASSGLEFEIRPELFANEITQDIKVAVYLSKPDNLGSLSANASGTQFVAITEEDWNPGGNVTIIKTHQSQTAFLSGYISALLAPNFRVGALLTAENPAFNQSFLNGVQYYCGTCTSVVYPLSEYPVISIQSSGSPPATWQAAADQVSLNTLNVLFVAEDAYSAELFNHLTGKDIALVGTTPPPGEATLKWVVTVRSDGLSPIQEVWEKLIAGQGGTIINADFKIDNYQFIYAMDGLVWLSQGKSNYLDQTIQLLRENFIDPSTTVN